MVPSRGPPPKVWSLASRSRARASPAVTAPASSFAIGARALTETLAVPTFETLPSASATVYSRFTMRVASFSLGE